MYPRNIVCFKYATANTLHKDDDDDDDDDDNNNNNNNNNKQVQMDRTIPKNLPTS
jgi:hypothetical protein